MQSRIELWKSGSFENYLRGGEVEELRSGDADEVCLLSL
jgi:hypothetical protein